MTAPARTETVPIPDVYQDDNGWFYYAAGHHDSALFVLGVVASNIHCCGEEEGWEQTTGLPRTIADTGALRDGQEFRDALAEMTRDVQRLWYRPDPHDDDVMLICEPSDPGAEPYTRLACG
jgi:hypothetical protein